MQIWWEDCLVGEGNGQQLRVPKDITDEWCPSRDCTGTIFNIFIMDINRGIKCTLSKSADNTKPSGEADMPEGWDIIQRELEKLKTWTHGILMGFNIANCKVWHSLGCPETSRLWSTQKHRLATSTHDIRCTVAGTMINGDSEQEKWQLHDVICKRAGKADTVHAWHGSGAPIFALGPSFSFTTALLSQQLPKSMDSYRPWTRDSWFCSRPTWYKFLMLSFWVCSTGGSSGKPYKDPRNKIWSFHVVLGFGTGILIFNKLASLQFRYYWLICTMYGQECVWGKWAGRRGCYEEFKGKQVPLLHLQCHQPDSSKVAWTGGTPCLLKRIEMLSHLSYFII